MAIPVLTGGSYYYASQGGVMTEGSFTVFLSFVPIWLPAGATLDRIGVNVTSAGDPGSTISLGIYSDDGRGFPQTRLLDAGTAPVDVTGVAEITIGYTVPSDNLYWLAANEDYDTGGPQPLYWIMDIGNNDRTGYTMFMNGVSPSPVAIAMPWGTNSVLAGELPNPAPGPFAALDFTSISVRVFVRVQ